MTMATWFTADTHFGHANIIKYCSRPFATADEMDDTLVRNWNAVVAPHDEVWHLGDFAFRNPTAAANYLRRLHGRVHLVWGNHDPEQVRRMEGWASSQAYAEVTVEGTPLVLFHYGMRVWNRMHRGAIHLYGHSHGTLPGSAASVDVGVDNPAWDYRPVSLDAIRRQLRTHPETSLSHNAGAGA